MFILGCVGGGRWRKSIAEKKYIDEEGKKKGMDEIEKKGGGERGH